MYARLGKTWAESPLLHQNRIVTILWKRVLKQVVGGAEEKSEIVAIPNKYKDTLNDLIDNSDTESPDRPDSPDRPGLIDKGSRNAPRSRGSSPTLSEEDRLDEDVQLEPAPKIRAFQMHERHDVTPLGPKSGRAQYGNSQRGREDRKGKRGGENGKGERGHGGNKVGPVVEKSSGSEASDYYHIIYQC